MSELFLLGSHDLFFFVISTNEEIMIALDVIHLGNVSLTVQFT